MNMHCSFNLWSYRPISLAELVRAIFLRMYHGVDLAIRKVDLTLILSFNLYDRFIWGFQPIDSLL